MIHVSEAFALNRRSLRAAFDTFEQACAYVDALKPICFEVDEENPGCADAFLPGGMILVVEPANR
jgi:hypothetical protein